MPAIAELRGGGASQHPGGQSKESIPRSLTGAERPGGQGRQRIRKACVTQKAPDLNQRDRFPNSLLLCCAEQFPGRTEATPPPQSPPTPDPRASTPTLTWSPHVPHDVGPRDWTVTSLGRVCICLGHCLRHGHSGNGGWGGGGWTRVRDPHTLCSVSLFPMSTGCGCQTSRPVQPAACHQVPSVSLGTT